MAVKTITLTGTEASVTGLEGSNAAIRNDSTETLYAAKTAGIITGADGVLSIPAGQSAVLFGIAGAKVFLLGNGPVMIASSDYSENPFKSSAFSGGSDADETARTAISLHVGNAKVHVSADDRANWNDKADSLDNYWLYTLDSGGNNHGENHRLYAQFNVKNDGRFYIQDEDAHQVRVNYADEADTLDGLHSSDLALAENQFLNDFLSSAYGDIRTLFIHLPSGGFGCNTEGCPDITGFPLTGDILITWFKSVFSSNGLKYGTLQVRSMTQSSLPVYQCSVYNNGSYTEWQKLCDGGNAASVGAYTESAIAALEARIAALEGSTT